MEFKTYDGYFKYLVILFGIANALATFQEMMNEILRDLIDQEVVVYINNILTYIYPIEKYIL
jgi:hypothetical protein